DQLRVRDVAVRADEDLREVDPDARVVELDRRCPGRPGDVGAGYDVDLRARRGIRGDGVSRVVDRGRRTGLWLLAAGRDVADVDVVAGANCLDVVRRVELCRRGSEGAQDPHQVRIRRVRPEVRAITPAAGTADGVQRARVLRAAVAAERRGVPG